jgi:hypothetical protein
MTVFESKYRGEPYILWDKEIQEDGDSEELQGIVICSFWPEKDLAQLVGRPPL